MGKKKVRVRKVMIDGKKEDVVIEDDYRKQLINMAIGLGCEPELRQIFAKYDTLLKNCKNKDEAKAASVAGVLAVSNLLDNGYLGINGSLTINGVKVLGDDKDRRDAGPDLVEKYEKKLEALKLEQEKK